MTDADRIRAYASAHPEAKQADVARGLGVSRSAVHNALKRYRGKGERKPRCPSCGRVLKAAASTHAATG